MKKPEEICDKPKTKLELLLDLFRDVLKYFDRNKLEACIFFATLGLVLSAWAIGSNADKINSIIQFFK